MDNLTDSMGSRNIQMKSLVESVSQTAKITDEFEATMVQVPWLRYQCTMTIQNIKKAGHTTYQMISMESIPYSMDEAITGCKQTPPDVGPLGELLEKLMASSEAEEKHYHTLQQYYQAASASCTTGADSCRQKVENCIWGAIFFIGILGAGIGSAVSSRLGASILAGIGNLDIGIIATWLGITLGFMAASVLGAMATVREIRRSNTVVVVLGIAAVVGIITGKVGLGIPQVEMLFYEAIAGLVIALAFAIMGHIRLKVLAVVISILGGLGTNVIYYDSHTCFDAAIGIVIATVLAAITGQGYIRELGFIEWRTILLGLPVFVLVVWVIITGDLWQGIVVGINCVISQVVINVIGVSTMTVNILITTIKKLKDHTSKFDSLNCHINALQNIATQNCANIQETMKLCQDLKHTAKFDQNKVKRLAEILAELQRTSIRSHMNSSDIHALETMLYNFSRQ